MNPFAAARQTIADLQSERITGRVHALRGLAVVAKDLPAPVGSLVAITTSRGDKLGEIVGFQGELSTLMMLENAAGVRAGSAATVLETRPTVPVSVAMLGRVIDGLARPIDGGPPIETLVTQPLHAPPIGALERAPISTPITTGVRAIDTMNTVGRGQRVGIFAGPGVGKSTLLGMIARGTAAEGGADVNVIALVGERGREVKEFIENALGPEGLARSVVIVSTSDQSPVLRIRAANTACAVAEYFRDRGNSVTLMLDSITRFAHAQRQIGLAAGEPPTTRGYTPSVFSTLSEVLERAGTVADRNGDTIGSITGFYTILVEGDDMTEPITDAARGILDGHLTLSRKIAQRGAFPAIDVLDSVSRLAGAITPPELQAARRLVLKLLAEYGEAEELIRIGAYADGSNPETDTAIAHREGFENLIRQDASLVADAAASSTEFINLAAAAEAELIRRKSHRAKGPAVSTNNLTRQAVGR